MLYREGNSKFQPRLLSGLNSNTAFRNGYCFSIGVSYTKEFMLEVSRGLFKVESS